MTNHAVIRADYANWRPVAGRKVLQLIFEVPIEQTADVLAKLGVPMPGESRWVAVALLTKEVLKQEAKKEPRLFAELPLSQQAALRCNDKDFLKFLEAMGLTASLPDDWDPAEVVRIYCEIPSRSHLDKPTPNQAKDKWAKLERDFQTWLTTQRYAEARR